MSNQEMFVKLMQDITDDKSKVSMQSKVEEYKNTLEKTCTEFTHLLKKGVLLIEAENKDMGFEFCPFCCTGGEEAKFKFVWVGVNPGIADGRWPQKFYWDKTTWQDMADFYVPKGDIRYQKGQSRDNPQNVYQWLSEDGVWSSYYKLMIRVHMALVGKKKCYGKWSDLWDAYSQAIGSEDEEIINNAISDAFLQQLNDNPTLNAELLPFKSREMKIEARPLKDEPRYQAYFRSLMDFIAEKASEDAWILFFGDTETVKRLLSMQKYIQIPKEEPYVIGEKGKPATKFYFQMWGKRKVVFSPFLQPYHKNGNDITKVINEVTNYFNKR